MTPSKFYSGYISKYQVLLCGGGIFSGPGTVEYVMSLAGGGGKAFDRGTVIGTVRGLP